MDIASKIKRARAKLKLSQSQAAQEWGVNVRTLQAWEQGAREPQGLARKYIEGIIRGRK